MRYPGVVLRTSFDTIAQKDDEVKNFKTNWWLKEEKLLYGCPNTSAPTFGNYRRRKYLKIFTVYFDIFQGYSSKDPVS